MSKTSDPSSDKKKQLLERLQRHPQLMDRVEAIVGLAESSLDQISTPDELEILLQEQLRLLGKASIECWGAQGEQEAVEDFKNQNPGARYGKKNS
jgi:hypothetical protein